MSEYDCIVWILFIGKLSISLFYLYFELNFFYTFFNWSKKIFLYVLRDKANHGLYFMLSVLECILSRRSLALGSFFLVNHLGLILVVGFGVWAQWSFALRLLL